MFIGISIGLVIWASITLLAFATLEPKQRVDLGVCVFFVLVLVTAGGTIGFLIEKAFGA